MPSGLLLQEASVVHDLADGWLRARTHLDEVQPGLSGDQQRLVQVYDADLLALRADESDPDGVDALVHAGLARQSDLASYRFAAL